MNWLLTLILCCLCISQEFIDQFQVLLPKNARASKEDIFAYLNKLQLDKNYCQIGKTKVCETSHNQIRNACVHCIQCSSFTSVLFCGSYLNYVFVTVVNVDTDVSSYLLYIVLVFDANLSFKQYSTTLYFKDISFRKLLLLVFVKKGDVFSSLIWILQVCVYILQS